MLSRKEGRVGYVIYNNRREAQRGVARHVGGRGRHPRRLPQRPEHRRGGGDRRGRQGLRVGRRHLAVREGALRRGDGRSATTPSSSKSYRAFHEFPKPTIAMIRGYCIGGGMGLATCCDLRICTDNSTFAVPAAKLGLGYAYRRPQAADRHRRAVVRHGDLLHGAAIHRRGGPRDGPGESNSAESPGELEKYVKDYADMIAGNAPLTIKAVKGTVAEIMKEESERDRRAQPEAGGGVLQQQRLPRRPQGLHGEAQAGVHRHLKGMRSPRFAVLVW